MMHMLLVLLACTATQPEGSDPSCDPRVLDVGEVRARQIHCPEDALEDGELFRAKLKALGDALNKSQRAAIAFQKCWSRLSIDAGQDVEAWWAQIRASASTDLAHKEKACVDAFNAAVAAC